LSPAPCCFHAAAWLFMGIEFSGLWLTYVVFVDWEALAHRWTRARRSAMQSTAPSSVAAVPGSARVWPSLLVGLVPITGAVEAGVRGATTGWPFACYPTFKDRAGVVVPALVISLVRGNGQEVPFNSNADAPPGEEARERIFGLSPIAAAGTTDAPACFAAYWDRLLTRRSSSSPALAADLRAVRFYRAEISTLPEDRSQPPRVRALIYELSPGRESTMMPRARSGATTSAASEDSARIK
jgi:hypothetical protein